MSNQRWNCLRDLDTIRHQIRMKNAGGVEIRYYRDISTDPDDRELEECMTTDAQFGTVMIRSDLGEQIDIHDFTLDSKGRAEALECVGEILLEINERVAEFKPDQLLTEFDMPLH